MVWCATCAEEVEVDVHEADGFTCCVQCGRVLEDMAFSADPTFVKGADGEGEMVGQFVSETGQVRGLTRMAGGRVWGVRNDSHDIALGKGRHELAALIDHFTIRPRDDTLEAAHRLYRLAVQHGFTKGRRVQQVAGACLYIICRQEAKPFMLIDYADTLGVNVYALGGVYLQLCKLLRLEEHPALTKPVDPSLYMHRFAEKLGLGERSAATVNTALRLVGSMKRDWMQTGRRPAGLCGAALFLASHVHGAARTKREVMAVVHIGWATLDRRVREFAETSASSMTVREFEEAAREAEEEEERIVAAAQRRRAGTAKPPAPAGADGGALAAGAAATAATTCEHVAMGDRHYASGMCSRCFSEFVRVSGGTWAAGADPPAFRNARRKEALAPAAGGAEDDGAEMLAYAASRGIGPDEARRAIAEEREFNAAITALALPAAADEHPAQQQQQQQRRGRQRGSTQAEPPAPLAPATQPQDGEPAGRIGDSLLGYGSAVFDAAAARAGAPALRTPRTARATTAAQRAQAADKVAGPGAAAGAAERPAKRVHFRDGGAAAVEAGGGDGPSKRTRRQAGGAAGGDAGPSGATASGALVPMASAGGAGAGGGGDGGQQPQQEEPQQERESLSDLDDDELAGYIMTAREARLKGEIWTQLNREWLEAQAARAAGLAAQAAAARAAAGGEGEAADAAEAAVFAQAQAASGRSRRGARGRQAAADGDEAGGAAGAAEEAGTARDAALAMLAQQRLSDKINYAALEGLFSSAPVPAQPARGGDASAAAGPSRRGAGGASTSAAVAAQDGPSPGPKKRDARAAAAPRAAPRRAADPGPAAPATQPGRAPTRGDAAAPAAADARFTRALEAEKRRSGGRAGGLDGSFLSALSTRRTAPAATEAAGAPAAHAAGGSAARAGRARPTGVAPRPRARPGRK